MKYTPYRFITSVMAHLGVSINKKLIKGYLQLSKILLDKLRSLGFDDDDILQMVSYTCNDMSKNGMPRDFRYFGAIMQRFIIAYSNKDSNTNSQELSYSEWIKEEVERLREQNLTKK